MKSLKKAVMSAVLVLSFQTTAQAIDNVMAGSDVLLGSVVARTRSFKFDFAKCAANWTSRISYNTYLGGCALKGNFAAMKNYETITSRQNSINFVSPTASYKGAIVVSLDQITVSYQLYGSAEGKPPVTYLQMEAEIRAKMAELAAASGSTSSDVIHIQYQTVVPAPTTTTTTLAP